MEKKEKEIKKDIRRTHHVVQILVLILNISVNVICQLWDAETSHMVKVTDFNIMFLLVTWNESSKYRLETEHRPYESFRINTWLRGVKHHFYLKTFIW